LKTSMIQSKEPLVEIKGENDESYSHY